MKSILIFYCLLLLSITAQAQAVIGSVGGSGTVGAMHLDYTVGEAMVSTINNNRTTLNQGFHQARYVVTAVQEAFAPGTINVFPNPTSAMLQIEFKAIEFKNLRISLHDELGRSINTSKADAATWQTNLSGLGSGYYMLTVTDRKNLKTSSFKILKIN